MKERGLEQSYAVGDWVYDGDHKQLLGADIISVTLSKNRLVKIPTVTELFDFALIQAKVIATRPSIELFRDEETIGASLWDGPHQVEYEEGDSYKSALYALIEKMVEVRNES